MLASHRDPWSGYRVTPEHVRGGGVGLAMSVLYRPGEEFGRHYTEPPESRYFRKLLEDLQDVEDDAATYDPARSGSSTTAPSSTPARPSATALVHCVEGGFHLGDEPEEIKANIKTLADKGIVYVTVAHLFYRQVAKNAPALPFLRWDWVYNLLFPQPAARRPDAARRGGRARAR